MWRSKKFIVIALLATVLLVGSISGVALAQTGNGEESQPDIHHGALLDRVIAIYEEQTGTAIDSEELKAAFALARDEMCPEHLRGGHMIDPEARQEHLQSLIEQGRITQEQADKMTERWESMIAEGEGFGFRGHGRFHGMGGPNAMLMR